MPKTKLMLSELAAWVWILKCSSCSRLIDFNDLHKPTQPLAEWAKCCGKIMELETVLRSPEDA